MVTGETQDLVAVVTLAEVEGHGAMGAGPVRGSDGESESGGKGTANVHVVLRLEEALDRPTTCRRTRGIRPRHRRCRSSREGQGYRCSS
jgi:hypothetical protein